MTHNQQIELNNGLLLFKPKKKTYDYGFIINYQQAKLKISFELQLTFLGIENLNFATYSINRKRISINNEEPDLILYKIANEMSNAIYPVTFTINQNLECVSINNHKEIISRCKTTEQKIANYYQGAIPEKMIVNFKESYNNKTKLVKQIQKELWFQWLFFPIYNSYNMLLQSKKNYKWLVDERQIEFELKNNIEKFYNSNGKVVVHTSSIASSEKQGSYQATYCLHPEKHTIASIQGTIVYPEEERTETLRFECYHLNS